MVGVELSHVRKNGSEGCLFVCMCAYEHIAKDDWLIDFRFALRGTSNHDNIHTMIKHECIIIFNEKCCPIISMHLLCVCVHVCVSQFPSVTHPQTLERRYQGILTGLMLDLMKVKIRRKSLKLWF